MENVAPQVQSQIVDQTTPDITIVQNPPIHQPVVENIQVPQTLPFYKSRIFILIAITFLLIISLTGFLFYSRSRLKSLTSIPNLYPDWTPYPMASFIPAKAVPLATPSIYRNPKGDVNIANNLPDSVKASLGVIVIPNTNYIHNEVYKNITIKWTAGQPIPEERLLWIKDSIDTAPDFYTKNYPPQAIISATADELGMSKEQSLSATATSIAAASGTNIFLWPAFTKPNPTEPSLTKPLDFKYVQFILMHEWMHVVQYYDGVESYTDDYITHNIAGLYDLNYKSPLVKKFGEAAGWYYQYDYSATPTLKSDVESQKTTDYGKMLVYEDMADTASNIITCDTSMLSMARINIMTEILGQTELSFCN
jgi:hypothetical protein